MTDPTPTHHDFSPGDRVRYRLTDALGRVVAVHGPEVIVVFGVAHMCCDPTHIAHHPEDAHA